MVEMPAKDLPLMRQRKLVLVSCLCLAAFSLWLRAAVPVFAIGSAAHDDRLFVRLAYHLGAGLWLGPYDQLTLAKGMAYPAFILAAFAAGIPLKLAEQGLYLAAAGVAAWLVARLTGSRVLPILLFGCLAFNPALWTTNLARVIREGTYVGLSLAVVMLAAALLLTRRSALAARAHVALMVMLGVVGAVFWLTREEGVWIVPTLVFLVVAAAAGAWWNGRTDGSRPAVRRVALVVGTCVIPGVVFAAILGTVAGMNYWAYGAFTINEVQSAPFRAAYGALTRIPQDQWRPYIVFPKDARERAYSVSEAARELLKTLDGEVGGNWSKMGCEQMRIDDCAGIPAGWFMWGLRDAVAQAGHYSSAGDSLAFYKRLAAEINAACDDGRLACLPERATLAPPFRWVYVGDALAKIPILAYFLIDPGDVGAAPSVGTQLSLALFADLVGPLSAQPLSNVVLLMTARGVAELPQFVVRDRNVAPFRFELRAMPREDTAMQGSARAFNLELETDCVRSSCELIVWSGADKKTFSIADLAESDSFFAASDMDLSLRRMFKRGRGTAIPVASEIRRDLQLRFMRAIAQVYRYALPIFAGLGALSVVLAIALGRLVSAPVGVLPLVLACAVAVVTRVVMLAYIDVSAFPAANSLYVSAASPFLVMFAVLGSYLGARWCCGLRGQMATATTR